MMFDPKFSFETEEISKATYYFQLDSRGKPIKLGDGSFGIVYRVCDEKSKVFAVKLLYQTHTMQQSIQNLQISDATIQELCEEFDLANNDQVIREIENLRTVCSSNFSNFVYKLAQTNISEDQYNALMSKVLYDARPATVRRFEAEIKAAMRIRTELQRKNSGSSGSFEGVIETVSGTKNFRDSQAYKSLVGQFKEIDTDVSDYALVMPMYSCTLKDLLEDGIGKYSVRQTTEIVNLLKTTGVEREIFQYRERQELEDEINEILTASPHSKGILKENIYELVGYDILESMDYKERISTILPYLRRIMVGLQTLYSVDFTHLDLKPANIFVQKRDLVDAVIGDLGFLEPEEAVSSHSYVANVDDVIALGTRHFRSPEQKDYFDICNVEITQENKNGKPITNLIVRDPKFQDTIIEKGDYVVFSRDNTRHRYLIHGLTTNHDNLTVITISPTEKAATTLKPDKQTQILLYKRPGFRTDLFGVGAIAFDLITCGKSPEQFYDDIKTYDRKDKSIAEIMDVYRSVSNFQATEPELAYIFSPFKGKSSSTYVPYQFVELILKCMLYKAKDTFFRDHCSATGPNHEKSIDAVFTSLSTLGNQYHPRFENNPLVTRKNWRLTDTPQTRVLADRIKDLHNMPLEDLDLRLAQGIWYFRQLVTLIRRTVSSKDTFFAEILPNNVIIADSGQMEFLYTIYQTQQNYIEDLGDDLVYAKISRNTANPYVPTDIAFSRRTIELKALSASSNVFQYYFSDTAEYRTRIEEGDWIIFNATLYQISEVSAAGIKLKNMDNSAAGVGQLLSSSEDGKSISCIFYKNLRASSYYLNMLGIYLQQIFFSGIGDSSIDRPALIKIAQTRQAMKPSAVKIDDEFRRGKGLKAILKWITSMYLRLIFNEDGKSFNQQKKSDLEKIISVDSQAQELQEMIENYVGVNLATLNVLVDEAWFRTAIKKTDINTQKLMKEYRRTPNFESMIGSSLWIQLRDKPINLSFMSQSSPPQEKPSQQQNHFEPSKVHHYISPPKSVDPSPTDDTSLS